MNHPHEQQAAAMARAGELTDGEQLRECINSGQVSAAQVVAHAEKGELSMSMFASREDFDKAVAQLPIGRVVTYNAGGTGERNVIERFDKPGYGLAHSLTDGTLLYSAAALAAERAEVARLRQALGNLLRIIDEPTESAVSMGANCDTSTKPAPSSTQHKERRTMTDLDARVAALMMMVDEYVSDLAFDKFKELEKAIRAELQKPAAPSKRKEAMHLHKFEALGAEEPAQEEITDADLDAWKCERCNGDGWYWESVQVAERESDRQEVKMDCRECDGTGYMGPDAIRASKGEKT